MMFRSTTVVRVPRSATTLSNFDRPDYNSSIHQFRSKGLKTALRHNSFKAFAQRNQNNAPKSEPDRGVVISTENESNSKVNAATTSSNNRGALSEMIKRNEANQSSWSNRRNLPVSRHNDNKGDNAIFASKNNTRTEKSTHFLPWEMEQRKKNHVDLERVSNRHNGKSNSSASYDDRGDRKNQGSAASTFHSLKASEDLKDISALRNVFMPHKPVKKQSGEPWLASSSYRQDNRFESSASVVGKRFTPSWYTPKKNDITSRSSDGNSSVVSKIDGNQSLEQVLRNNANQRKQDMAQRYLNAGEAVPFNIDEYGNSAGGGHTSYTWRQPAKNTNEYGKGARGGVLQRNNNNQRYAKNQYQHKDTQLAQSQTARMQQMPRKIQRGGPWARKNRRQALPSSAPKEVRLPLTPLTLVDLSLLLRVRKRTIVRSLRSLGEPISYQSANQDSFKIDPEMMEYICIDLGIEPLKTEQKVSSLVEAERRALRQLSEEMDEEQRTEEEEKYAALPPRAPVVCIMGHVDHGKTTLMDALRRRAVTMNASGGSNSKKVSNKKSKESKSRGGKGVTLDSDNVAGTEAGGITQVITSFEVPLSLDESGNEERGHKPISTVTFLDTPGHAAFKKMRQSGSSATDVIVLVVAADDGVSPQTIEIIDMFKSIARSQPQSISLVIAVSKIDKPGIDVDEAVMRIENQLMEHEIFTENVLAGGGDEGEFGACQLFPVSGLTGEGLDDLVEGLALQSELMDLRADYDARGEGIVIDARMERGLGVVADCVIRWGKVEPGDFVVSGTNGGKVRFLNDGKCRECCIYLSFLCELLISRATF